jgi:hypothetical protein
VVVSTRFKISRVNEITPRRMRDQAVPMIEPAGYAHPTRTGILNPLSSLVQSLRASTLNIGGDWTECYEVFAVVDGGRILSTIGRSRMHSVVNGELGYRLGAVATRLPYRR